MKSLRNPSHKHGSIREYFTPFEGQQSRRAIGTTKVYRAKWGGGSSGDWAVGVGGLCEPQFTHTRGCDGVDPVFIQSINLQCASSRMDTHTRPAVNANSSVGLFLFAHVHVRYPSQ